jgi:hypothetical protein
VRVSEVLTSIEHITRSRSCRVAFSRTGRHQFGGKPEIAISGITPPAHVHHLFTLDTHDRNSPVRFEGVQSIPLIYPLAFSIGGGEISYRIVGDRAIEILHLSDYSPDDPPYFLLDALPELRASLKPLTYAERRILGSSIRDKSLLDRWRMRRLWNGECFRVSGILEYRSNLNSFRCPSAEKDGGNCDGWIFAYFPASKVPFGDIWHEYGADVHFCFAVCLSCSTIHAFNECT